MKKLYKYIALVILTLVCWPETLLAQPNSSYKPLESADKVDIYYKWKKKFPWGEDVARDLVLYIDNQNNKNVSVSFSVDIFVNAVLNSSSGILNYCLPSNYEIKGRFKDLAFDTGLSWEQLNSDTIIWEINSLKIQEIEGDCTAQSNWLKTE